MPVPPKKYGEHLFKLFLKFFYKRIGLPLIRKKIGYAEDGFFTIHYDTFRSDNRFRLAYKRGLQALFADSKNPKGLKSLVKWDGSYVKNTFGQWRIHIALWCGSTAARLKGDFVECGVFIGFTSSCIMEYLEWDSTGKIFYLIDTFQGPNTDQFNPEEIHSGRKKEVARTKSIGGYNYSFEMVSKNFQEWNNKRLIQGLVPEILSKCSAEQVAYLHLDMNCALPEVSAIEYFWDKLTPGGIILLDDYAHYGYKEQNRAINTLAEKLGFSVASLPTGQGLVIKT